MDYSIFDHHYQITNFTDCNNVLSYSWIKSNVIRNDCIAKYLPDLATMNLFFTPHTSTLLNGSQGLLVQVIWSLFLGLISFGLIQYRDVR